MSPNIIQIAIQKAKQSFCRFRVSAIGLDRRGNIVATAVNRPRLDKFGGGKHAEMIILEKGGNRICTIIICRIGNSGELQPIKCCSSCRKVLDKKNIKVYTTK